MLELAAVKRLRCVVMRVIFVYKSTSRKYHNASLTACSVCIQISSHKRPINLEMAVKFICAVSESIYPAPNIVSSSRSSLEDRQEVYDRTRRLATRSTPEGWLKLTGHRVLGPD